MKYCVVEMNIHAVFLEDVVEEIIGPFDSMEKAYDCIDSLRKTKGLNNYRLEVRPIHLWD